LAELARRPWAATICANKLFRKIRNRARLFFGSQNPWSHGRKRGPEIQENANPNFFARNPLNSLVSPKKKFGKICKVKSSPIENKGNFLPLNRRILQKPRLPRILQGLTRRPVGAGRGRAIGQRWCFLRIA
jgi:hypothetical protein